MPPEQINGKLDGWKEKNGEEEWQLSQIKLKEHAYEEKGWTELLENQQGKEQACCGLMENFSKLRRNSATTETID